MSGITKFEHAHLYVTDLDSAVDFYTDVMGLSEVTREEGVVYLGCRPTERYDLAVQKGGTGIEHFAVRVPDEATLEEHEAKLDANGVAVERHDGSEPGQESGVRFSLPSGVAVELVTVPSVPAERDIGRPLGTPQKIDHITCLFQDVRKNIEFLAENLEFNISEAVAFQESDGWNLGFSRYGDQHHDVAGIHTDDPDYTLHHLAWSFVDISHLITHIDQLARNGTELELGMTRHGGVAGNISAYFFEPGGNRFEYTTEMPSFDESDPTTVQESRGTFTYWGGVAMPDTWSEGS